MVYDIIVEKEQRHIRHNQRRYAISSIRAFSCNLMRDSN
jgi:hypothetical protein